MRVHAIQTGTVKIKTAQVEGRGRGLIGVFLDPNWTDWVPTYAWAIEHPDGVIVVDSGQGAHLLEHSRELNPYVRWEVAFQIEREQEIGPQLRALGIGPRDVKKVLLTHLHMDHDGGLAISQTPKSWFLLATWPWRGGCSAGCEAIFRIAGPHGSTRRRSSSRRSHSDRSRAVSV